MSINEGKSAAGFCHQVPTWFQDMFCNFYLVKNHKIAQNATTTKAREKICADLETFELKNFFNACLTKKFKNQKFLIHMNHRFLLTTKLLTV